MIPFAKATGSCSPKRPAQKIEPPISAAPSPPALTGAAASLDIAQA